MIAIFVESFSQILAESSWILGYVTQSKQARELRSVSKTMTRSRGTVRLIFKSFQILKSALYTCHLAETSARSFIIHRGQTDVVQMSSSSSTSRDEVQVTLSPEVNKTDLGTVLKRFTDAAVSCPKKHLLGSVAKNWRKTIICYSFKQRTRLTPSARV